MSDDMQALENWVQPLIAKLQPAEQRKLAREVAKDLRRAQSQRIAAQKNPDGSPFEPRKPQARNQSGSIRRQKMFTKIRQAKHLKATRTNSGAEVGFVGRVARIARIHQKGLRAPVEPGGPMHDYPERRLLGFGTDDRRLIQDSLINHLT